MINGDEIRQEQTRILSKHKRMKETVWNVLSEHERARNDDRWLILKVLESIGQTITLTTEAAVWYIDLNTFGSVPSFETITRVRREIQNKDGHFLPTDPDVLFHRKIKEETIKTYYRGDTKIIDAWSRIAYDVR